MSAWVWTAPSPRLVATAIRSGRGGVAACSVNDIDGSWMPITVPGTRLAEMSSRAALSRTDVVTAWCTEAGALSVEGTGKLLTRPRLGLRPTRPLIEAGIRIEPPPSLACATGTIPAATAEIGRAHD